MSADSASSSNPQTTAAQPAQTAPAEKGKHGQPRVFLMPYPKVVFLYPTFFFALVAGIFYSFAPLQVVVPAGVEPGTALPVELTKAQTTVSLLFLGVFGANLVILGFDFPRTTWLTFFFVAVALVLGLLLLFTWKPDVLPALASFLAVLRPVANSQFYFLIAGILGAIYLCVLIAVRFDYWEVRPNELLHHHGFLSDLERFPAPNLRIEKEINDVFEYLLLRSGRLILQHHGGDRPIVLENILFISKKEQQVTRMLSALQVRVRQD